MVLNATSEVHDVVYLELIADYDLFLVGGDDHWGCYFLLFVLFHLLRLLLLMLVSRRLLLRVRVNGHE